MLQINNFIRQSSAQIRIAIVSLGCLLVFLLPGCGDSSNGAAKPVETPDFIVKVGDGLNLSPEQVDGQILQGNSLISILVEWTIIKPVIDPNSSPPAVILNPNSTTPTFVAYVAGTYVLRMVVIWTETQEVWAEREITIKVSADDIAAQKPGNHIASTDMCFACHNQNSWLLPIVDHTQVLGVCSSCHDGVIATGKSPSHVVTDAECDICHTSNSWFSATQLPIGHMDFTGNCFSCHDGIAASGKPFYHINSSNTCDACHTKDIWAPMPAAQVDHTQVIGTCESCHDGVVARGKGPTHVVTQDACDLCHVSTSWLDVTGCTNGNPCPQPDPNAGNNPGQAGNAPDHSVLVGACVSCHNGVDASGKSATHIASSDVCDACHQPAPTPWAPLLTVDHNQTIGTCSSCHDGVIATGKPALHVVTTRECDVCHLVTYWIPPPLVQ